MEQPHFLWRRTSSYVQSAADWSPTSKRELTDRLVLKFSVYYSTFTQWISCLNWKGFFSNHQIITTWLTQQLLQSQHLTAKSLWEVYLNHHPEVQWQRERWHIMSSGMRFVYYCCLGTSSTSVGTSKQFGFQVIFNKVSDLKSPQGDADFKAKWIPWLLKLSEKVLKNKICNVQEDGKAFFEKFVRVIL